MTMAELVSETLVEKHQRLMRAKCRHEEVFSSTFVSTDLSFTDRVCLDCGTLWRIDSNPQ